jgi:1-acyl-sn-glycerol-3-phosphate acyltransferase
MTDAKVISMGGDRPRTPGARSVLVGADRASGERARRRRRTTPLLTDTDTDTDTEIDQSAEPTQVAEVPGSATTAIADVEPAKPVGRKKPGAKKSSPKQPAKKQVTEKQVTEKPKPRKKPADVVVNRVPLRPIDVDEPHDLTEPAVRSDHLGPAGEQEPLETLVPPGDEPVPTGGRHSVVQALLMQAGAGLLEAVTSRARPAEVEAKVGSVLRFLERRLSGEYELDDFGFDAEFAEAVPLTLLRPLYKHWFRVEVRGIENLPTSGGALIVANHSGAIPIDALMTSVAVHEEHPQRRFLRILGADLLFQTPFLAGLARRGGATLASNPDAERLLAEGHLVGVWPEGFKGIGKPFTERYKLQRFGRGGFVSAALRTGTPIVPCSIVGAEETYPIIGNVPSLARLLGLPYLPLTPFFPLLGPLGAIPLPSKWLIEFGSPVLTDEYDASAAEDPMLVFDLTDQIRQSIQQTLYSLLVQRRSIFF